MNSMNIILNGQEIEFLTGETLAALIIRLGLQHKKIAIEHNGTIIPKSFYNATILAQQDRLEIISAVGGG